jgi:hypothetical protein
MKTRMCCGIVNISSALLATDSPYHRRHYLGAVRVSLETLGLLAVRALRAFVAFSLCAICHRMVA